jgi:type IV pilus assembly protein PilW
VELLVALVVTGTIAAATLAAILASREILDRDMGRVRLDQDLRTGVALLGIEVRQAGERLPEDFPAVEIINGSSGGPDTLIIRKNLLDDVLPICADIAQGTTTDEIRIAKDGSTPPKGCPPVPDGNGDGWPDNLESWRARRAADGGTLLSYIYNPVAQDGEFFVYDGDGSTTHYLHKADTGAWANDYGDDEQCRVYLLEERRYEMSGDVLRFVVNGDTSTPLLLLHGVIDFQVRGLLEGGTVVDSLSASDDWSALVGIDVSVTGTVIERGQMRTRTVTSTFFPRNVLSL